jgi:hypothetical protein
MRHLALSLVAALAAGAPSAQEAHEIAAQANNPLANVKALNFQNYYIGDSTGRTRR